MDIFTEIEDLLGITKPELKTPELGLYQELTEGKMPKIHNVQYWFKHELCVYVHILNQNWIVSKPSGTGRQQVNLRELSRALLEYYFMMMYLPHFINDRAEEQGKLVGMQKFLDLVVEYPTIKKLIENPHELV